MSVKSNVGVVTDGLVFYVDAGNQKSYAGTGTTWSDLVGGNDGTLTNGPTFNSNNAGSVSFDGNDDYVVVSSSSDLTPSSSSYSLSFWLKYNGPALTTSSVIEGVFEKGIYSLTGSEIQITFRGSASYNGIYFRLRDSSNIDQVIPSSDISSIIGDGSFHHYACIIDRTSNSIKIYFDGSLVGTTSGLTVASISTTSNIFIGRYLTYYGSFQMSNIAIYKNKSLTSTEVLQNYNALKNRFV